MTQRSGTALKCGWTSPSGIFICTKQKGHTGNHRTVRFTLKRSTEATALIGGGTTGEGPCPKR